MEKGKSIISAYQKLVNDRLPLDVTWNECFRYSYEMRGQGFVNKHSDGITAATHAKKDAAVKFDSTATDSIRLLSSSALSGLTPNSQQWFSLTINNMQDDLIPYADKAWLENAAELMFKNIHASNYDAQALEFFIDIMVGGMLGLYVEKRDKKYHFEVWPLSTLYCQDTLGKDRIDTVYRLVKFTAAEAMSKFDGNVPEAVANEFKATPYSNKQFDFIHTIRPRLDKKGRQVSGSLKRTLPFESIYVCAKSGKVCLESGYHEMPVIVPRWMRIPGTDYATGPMNDALPDVKTVCKITEFMLKNSEMATAGMYVATDDGVFNPNTMRIGPGRVWMTKDVNNIKPLAPAGDMNVAVAQIQRLQNQIRKVLLADQLGPSEKVNATATEITTRTMIIRQILGPIFGRLQSEFLEPLITRCFGLGLRDGDFGPPPQSLEAMLFNITYRSPLALAQKQQQLEAMNQFEAILIGQLQINPELADVYDLEKALRKKAELLGVDIELIREESKVSVLRKKKQESQAAQAANIASQVPPEQMQKMLGGMAA